jgi:hypothetical protein
MNANRLSAFKSRVTSALFAAARRLLIPMICGRRAGTNFSRLAVDGFQSGITTCDQVAVKLGDPFGVSINGEGKRLATWCYAGRAGAMAVTIAFSNEGIMERVVAFCEIHRGLPSLPAVAPGESAVV